MKLAQLCFLLAFLVLSCSGNNGGEGDSKTDNSSDSDTAPGGDADEASDGDTLVSGDTETVADVADSDDGAASDDSPWVFDESSIRTYRLTLSESDWQHLQEDGIDEVYVPADLQIDDETWSNIGVRLKGSYSLESCWERDTRMWEGHCRKISMKLKFTEYDDSLRFHDLKKINLHSMTADPTNLRERLAYHLFELMGSKAPRNVPARVYVNDIYLGIFEAVEAVDGRFTKNRFPQNGDGNLYKEEWPNGAVDEESALEALRTNDSPEDNPDVSDFLEFAASIASADASNYEQTVLPYVDVTQLLKYIAVDRAIHNWDGFLAFYGDWNHNYYWYHVEDGKWVLIPWDMDKTFFEYDRYFEPDPAEGIDEPVPQWNVRPSNCDEEFPNGFYTLRERIGPPEEGPATLWFKAPGCDNLIHILASQYWDEFAVHGNQLLTDWFNERYLNERIDEWSAQIDDMMQEEPGVEYADWVTAVATLRSHLPKLISDFETHLQDTYREE